jgi:hypothetical protein
MKAGTSKVKLYAAVILGIGAMITVVWTLIPSIAQDNTQAAVASDSGKIAAVASSESLDPRLHLDLLASAEGIKYEGSGKNIFRASDSAEDRIEPVKVPPMLGSKGAHGQTPMAAQPPGPPPINMKYFGLASGKGENPKAFLSQGDNIWVAKEGDVVNRHYKILRISPREVEIEDLLNSHRESIPLAQS